MVDPMLEPRRLTDSEKQFVCSMLTLDSGAWATIGVSHLKSFRSGTDFEGSNDSNGIVIQQSSSDQDRECAPQSEELLRLVESCKTHFWSDGAESWFQRLSEANFINAPELKGIAKRLQAWFSTRAKIVELANSMGKKSLASKMKNMATMSASEIAAVKMEIAKYRSRWFVGGYRKQAVRIRSLQPEVYALDPDWFDELIVNRP